MFFKGSDYDDYDEIPPEIRDNEIYAELAAENRKIKRRYCRMLIAFFFLGVCDLFNLMALTTAAVDIINENVVHNYSTYVQYSRNCTDLSAAVVVLTWVIPSTLISLVIPFLPMLVNFRIFACLVLIVIGYSIVASIKHSLIAALVGVVLVAIAEYVNEATLLQYTNYFHGNVIAAFASGSGVAGLIAALFISLGVSFGYKITLYSLISVPILTGVFFWILLPSPNEIDKQALAIQRAFNANEIRNPYEMLRTKYKIVPKVLYKYITPLLFMFIYECFINQGTYELLRVGGGAFHKNFQYHWLQVSFQVGVCISRSSVNFAYIKHIWIFACLQTVNVVIFTTDAIYWYIGSFWIYLMLAFEEGLLGGAAYVNTFVKIRKEEPPEEKQFITSLTCFGVGAGLLLGSLLAIFTHNYICELPPYPELKIF